MPPFSTMSLCMKLNTENFLFKIKFGFLVIKFNTNFQNLIKVYFFILNLEKKIYKELLIILFLFLFF